MGLSGRHDAVVRVAIYNGLSKILGCADPLEKGVVRNHRIGKHEGCQDALG